MFVRISKIWRDIALVFIIVIVLYVIKTFSQND